MPPLVTRTSSAPTVTPWRAARRPAMADRAAGSPSVGEYCSARELSSDRRVEASCWRTSTGKVSGAGKPPEKVITSLLAASERIAVSSSPPRLARRANSSGHVVAARRAVGARRSGGAPVTLTPLSITCRLTPGLREAVASELYVVQGYVTSRAEANFPFA